jgi:enoyl-CoA hydratase/carnithine racemase
MAWDIEAVDGCAVVRMNTYKVNVQNNHFFADLHGACDRLFQYPRPTVAAVDGHAIAGGLITALDCDFRVVARKPARFGLNGVPIGIPMPAVISFPIAACGSRAHRNDLCHRAPPEGVILS